MNCLMLHSETARQAGAGLLLSEAGPTLSLRDGATDLDGGFSKSVDNITHQRADWPRLVPVGINGVVDTFIFYPFHGEQL